MHTSLCHIKLQLGCNLDVEERETHWIKLLGWFEKYSNQYLEIRSSSIIGPDFFRKHIWFNCCRWNNGSVLQLSTSCTWCGGIKIHISRLKVLNLMCAMLEFVVLFSFSGTLLHSIRAKPFEFGARRWCHGNLIICHIMKNSISWLIRTMGCSMLPKYSIIPKLFYFPL